MAVDPWTIVNTTLDAHTLGQFSSVCTVSNGYLGLKGSVCAERDGYAPVTLIHGVYDELDMFSLIRASNEERRYLDARYFDSAGKSPAVANLPTPLHVRVFVDNHEVSLGRGQVNNFVQRLDLRTGVYRYQFDFVDAWGHTTRIAMERFACLRHAHRVFMKYTITPLDHAAPIRVQSGISGEVFSNTTRERQFRVTNVWTNPAERCHLTATTPARGHEVQLGVSQRVTTGTSTMPPVGVCEHDRVFTEYTFTPTAGAPIVIERHIALTCSEDLRHRVVADLKDELDQADAEGFDAACEVQQAAWRELWDRCDVAIDGDDQAQQYLRFCLFHLIQAAPRFTDRLSAPVKLLTGEYYQGNTFYDTDTYILPFYSFVMPEIARTCLNWRHEGLRPGREIARNLGYRGAKFAWQAGPYGEECLGRWWRFTHTNIHINGDASYALMQYLWVTNDVAYLHEHGVDMLVETARFYASRAEHDPQTDRYHIRDVAGPDEGHCESTDNFYTNYLAIQNLRWAADVLGRLEREQPAQHETVIQRLAVRRDEPSQWRHIAERLTLLFDARSKVYEQCAGFYELKPIPRDLLDGRKVWFVTVFPYQALNQPDVLMAMMMFRDAFPPDVVQANYEYYYDKSMNFSSMSFVINSILSADVGRHDEAYRNFIISAGEDVDEELTGRKDTFAGLHGTAAGGAWMAAVLGFGGVHASAQGLRINPRLPAQWKSLRFTLMLRGTPVRVEIDHQQVTLDVGAARPIEWPITVAGRPITLRSGERASVRYA